MSISLYAAGNKETFNTLLIIFLLSFALRFGFYFLGNTFGFPDSETFYQAGRSLFLYGFIESDYVMPMYPVITFLLRDNNLLTPVEIFISSLTVIVIYEISMALHSCRKTAIIASIIAALYPYFIYLSVSKLSETIYIFLIALSILSYYKKYFKTGHILACFGLLIKPVLELIYPILIFYFITVISKKSPRLALREIFIYLCFYVIFMTPWWLHNYNKYGEFVRLNLASGVVFYAGNNPMNKSGGGIVGIDYNYDIVRNEINPLRRDDIFVSESLRYIQDNPLDFFARAGKKFVRFWRLWPYAKEFNSYVYVLASLFSYGIVLFFSLLTFFSLSTAALKHSMPIFILCIYLTFVHLITISSIRYRIPLEPFLIAFSAYGINNIIFKFKKLVHKGD
jgi:4-amino-4-deoxy-L-arabinose transferase-like glycosyltransferase